MKNILYLSLMDWFWIKQRPQHITQLLSKYNKITYLCKVPWKNNNLDLDCNKNIKSILKINKNLTVIRIRLIPKEDNIKIIKMINTRIFMKYLIWLDKKNKFDIIILTHPIQFEYIPKQFLFKKRLIYDCMDNYACFPGSIKEKIIQNENTMVNVCDYIVASSNTLYNNLIKYNKNIKNKIYIINNGVDIHNFNRNNLDIKNEVKFFNKNNNIKVCYIGTISKWLDLKLIKNIAIKNKNIDFYLIGPIDKDTNIGLCDNINNIIFTGIQPYNCIPNILNRIDITVMPFKKNDLIESVNPVKIYEYLAMGKPVIALKYSETEKFKDLIYTYKTEEEFQKLLYKSINETKDNIRIQKKIDFANKNSWLERTNEFQKIINRL